MVTDCGGGDCQLGVAHISNIICGYCGSSFSTPQAPVHLAFPTHLPWSKHTHHQASRYLLEDTAALCNTQLSGCLIVKLKISITTSS